MSKLVIDGDSLTFYNTEEDIHEAINMLDRKIQHIFKQTGATAYIIFLSMSPYFRHHVYKEYKLNRKAYKQKTVTFQKTLFHYLREKYGAMIVPGIEADDAVATAAFQHNVIICSPDKDVLHQIPGKHYDYRFKLIGRGTDDEHMEYGRWVETSKSDADKFLWTQVMMGDATDNISGIPQVGIAKATKYIEELQKKELSLPAGVLRAYMDYYGVNEGILNFQSTYRVIRLLRTAGDYINEDLSPLTIEESDFILINSDNYVSMWNDSDQE